MKCEHAKEIVIHIEKLDVRNWEDGRKVYMSGCDTCVAEIHSCGVAYHLSNTEVQRL